MKLLHRIWIGGPEPAWTREFAATWERPGWEVIQWDDDSIKTLFPLHNQRLFDEAESIAPLNVGQFRTDVLRYEILFRYGGVYVDADFELLTTIDDLDAPCWAAWETQDVWVNNAIMGAMKFHPFIWGLIEDLAGNVARNRGARPNVMSGPQFLTKSRDETLTVYPEAWFYPYLWDNLNYDGDYGEARAVHHWANRRRQRNIPYRKKVR